MVATSNRALTQLLQQAGCNHVRPAKGSHDLWWPPLTQTHLTVPNGIVSRRKANAILKQVGLPESFWL